MAKNYQKVEVKSSDIKKISKSISKAVKKVSREVKKSRKKALNRAKGIRSRLEKKGYDLGDLDLESMSTRQLNKLDRKKIIQNYATQESIDKIIEEERALKERKKILRAQKRKLDKIRKREKGKKPENVISIEDAKKQDAAWKPGDTGVIPAGSDAKIQIDKIIEIIKVGESYNTKKDVISADDAVQPSATRIMVMFLQARNKYSDEEIVQKLEKTFGSMDKVAETVERLIYAIYDDVLAEWADGSSAYESLISTISGALGVTDPGFR